MPPYKEQGIVLRSVKLGEADKIVTILTQGSGKVRAVAKGLRKTTSRFGGRLEPFTHVNLMLYRGRGSPDVRLWSAALGGAVCPSCADRSAGPVSPDALALLAALAGTDLSLVGRGDAPDPRWSTEARGMLVGFTEYHLERRMRSVPMLVRTAR